MQAFLVFVFMITLFCCVIKQNREIERNKELKIEQEEKHINAKIGISDEDTLSNYLSYMPNEVTNTLLDNHWSYMLCSDSQMNEIAKEYGYKQQLIGLSVYDQKIIYISNKRIDTVIHETWHAVDSILGFPSKHKSSMKIYKEEKEAFLNAFPSVIDENSSTSMEYFAEAFQRYVMEKQTLRESCPKTYKYIKTQINNCSLKNN